MNPNSCFYHADLPAMFVCSRCGRKICGSCNKPYSGLTLCPNCYHSVPAPIPIAPPASAPAPPMGAPVGVFPPAPGPVAPAPVGAFGPGWYGPFPKPPLLVRWWWLPAVFVTIAAGLVIANAVALLSPGFMTFWGAFLPWVPALGPFNFIIGIILGIILFGAVVMIFLKFRVLAAFVIFPTAILSLFIGGGFFAGGILGIIGGILLLLK
ncbi:MAG TPA: hypothetical protein VMU35_02910 [Methylomirabilota bacterium]|nr:hypothetical protein [Methylomirabilota bacterium]